MGPANGLAGDPEKAAGHKAVSPFFIPAAVTEIETKREKRIV